MAHLSGDLNVEGHDPAPQPPGTLQPNPLTWCVQLGNLEERNTREIIEDFCEERECRVKLITSTGIGVDSSSVVSRLHTQGTTAPMIKRADMNSMKKEFNLHLTVLLAEPATYDAVRIKCALS